MIHTLRDEEALGSFVPERYLEAYLNDEEFARTFPFTPLTLLCYNRQIKIGREDVKGGTLNIIPLLRRTLKIPITSYRFEGLSYCPERKSWFLSVEI